MVFLAHFDVISVQYLGDGGDGNGGLPADTLDRDSYKDPPDTLFDPCKCYRKNFVFILLESMIRLYTGARQEAYT
jgi:hypothetical protein